MGEFHDASNRENEFVDLRFADHQRRRDFQDHEIVSANLGKDSVVAEQSHDQDLAEHGGMNPGECFEGKAQAQAAGNGELNSHEQSHAAYRFHHFVRGKLIPQAALQFFSQRVARFPRCSRSSTSNVARPARMARLFSLKVEACTMARFMEL